ncbi:hypothetical protein LX36DRAFT_324291 [Colletotrichum falcatum]|nr:hypothetical protein LX36DRAFT_324291 [Colletotrichum falcatum]
MDGHNDHDQPGDSKNSMAAVEPMRKRAKRASSEEENRDEDLGGRFIQGVDEDGDVQKQKWASEAEGSLCLGMGASVSHGIACVFLENRAGGRVQACPPNATAYHRHTHSLYYVDSGLGEGRSSGSVDPCHAMRVRRQGETARLQRAQRRGGEYDHFVGPVLGHGDEC